MRTLYEDENKELIRGKWSLEKKLRKIGMRPLKIHQLPENYFRILFQRNLRDHGY